MRVFISADIEGVSGMVSWKDEEEFTARKWMTADVNAAVEGAFDGGATRVCVRDAHGPARNIVPDDLDPRAELYRGWGVDSTMVEGVEDGFDAMFLVGYHSRCGTPDGIMSHTWNGFVRGVDVAGTTFGEIGIAALTAGDAGVPLAMVAGDDKASAEAELLIPGVRTAIVKYGMTRSAGRCLPLSVARERIRAAAEEAVSSPRAAPFVVEMPAEVTLRFRDADMARVSARLRGVRRSDDVSVTTTAESVRDILDFFFCATRIAGTVA